MLDEPIFHTIEIKVFDNGPDFEPLSLRVELSKQLSVFSSEMIFTQRLQ